MSDIALKEFGIPRKKRAENSGAPYKNYHTLSNNAVYSNPSSEQNISHHIPERMKFLNLLPAIKKSSFNGKELFALINNALSQYTKIPTAIADKISYSK